MGVTNEYNMYMLLLLQIVSSTSTNLSLSLTCLELTMTTTYRPNTTPGSSVMLVCSRSKKQKITHNRGGGRVIYEDSRRSKQLKCTICGKDTTTFCNGCGTKKGMHGNECLCIAKHWKNINNKG
jgi:hypothetical protein